MPDRRFTHGRFKETSRVAQAFKAIARNTPNWRKLAPEQQEAIDQNCTKLARILCGKFNHGDHWHDIGGYTQLIERILIGEDP